MVLSETGSAPWGGPASRPSSPESAACRAESSASMLKTMLLPAPASLGVLPSLAPAATRASALASVRFQTVTPSPDLLTPLVPTPTPLPPHPPNPISPLHTPIHHF